MNEIDFRLDGRVAVITGGSRGIGEAIAPGLTDTKFASILINTKEILDYALERIPLTRYAKPYEMAGAALFLASEASSFATSMVITVDGGSKA